MANIEKKVEMLLEKPIKEIGYKLYDVEYVKEGADNFLRIYIEKESGAITLDDCEKVNNGIIELLDEKEYIKEQYFLEVSSTGIEKNLRKDKHLQEYINKEINIKLFKKYENGKKELCGKLISFNKDNIVLENAIIERKNIAQIKNIYNW